MPPNYPVSLNIGLQKAPSSKSSGLYYVIRCFVNIGGLSLIRLMLAVVIFCPELRKKQVLLFQ